MSKIIDATSESIEGREREFSVGEIAVSGPPPIDIVTEDVLKGTAIDHERFNADILEVYLHDPVSEAESKHCFIGVNGDQMWLLRGGTYKLKRYHVGLLAQAKSGRVMQTKAIAPDGSQSYVDKEVLALSYPFSVVHDPSPRGAAWLRETLRAAA